jgi:hypothetical protein
MIYQGDTNQEEFTFGLSLNKQVLNSGLKVELPLQLLATHRGGQIDQSNAPVATYYNAALGVHLYQSSASVFNSWGLKAYAAIYQDANSSGTQPFEDGYGVYINPYITTRFGLMVMMSYWYANEFISVQGGTIYPSANEIYPLRIDEDRQLIMLRALYDVELADTFWLTLRAEPFYDTYSESLQYSFGIYLNLYERFYLTSVKKSR